MHYEELEKKLDIIENRVGGVLANQKAIGEYSMKLTVTLTLFAVSIALGMAYIWANIWLVFGLLVFTGFYSMYLVFLRYEIVGKMAKKLVGET